MAVKSVLGKAVRRFGRDRRGNYGMMMAVLAPTLLLGAGFGINIAQVSNTRSNLLAALDSAVTSTARDLTTGVIKEQDARASLEAFLFSNGVRSFSRRDRLTLDSVVLDKPRKTVEAKASVVVDVAFPLFGAANVQTITAESAARYSDRRIEVVMMLDVTGSMKKSGKTDKIGDLQAAARLAVTALLEGNRHSPDRIRISIVPYAEAVNVGALADSAVFFEVNGGPDLPPPDDDPYWASAPARTDNCATERLLPGNTVDYSDDAPDATNLNEENKSYRKLVNRDDRLVVCPSARIVALTSDETSLLDTIDAFKADGVTAGGIAAQWGYYMLSPKWRSAIAGAGMGDGPADHHPERVGKIAILMTDGAFNTAFAAVPGTEKPRMDQGSRSVNRAKSVCTRMKQDGIEVFTIGFALPSGESSSARKVLKDCASPDTPLTRHFYDAATGDALKTAFSDIVRNIERLALIK